MLKITDVRPLEAVLRQLVPGEPRSHGALTVVPLLDGHGLEPDWLTLVEAGEHVTVTEIGEAGAVPMLTITSEVDRPLLLIDGEELIGAKQNRILNTTVLLGARATATIPVSCVEQGRWAYRGRRAAPSSYSLYASLRRKKAARVSQTLRERSRHDGDQGEIWQGVAEKAERSGVRSPTDAMHAFFSTHAEELTRVGEALPAAPHQTGAIVYNGGEWVGLELLASPSLFARAWPRLRTGYIADALELDTERQPRVPPADVLARLMTSPLESAPAIGLGVEYRLSGREATGAVLIVDEMVAHLTAFPAVAD